VNIGSKCDRIAMALRISIEEAANDVISSEGALRAAQDVV